MKSKRINGNIGGTTGAFREREREGDNIKWPFRNVHVWRSVSEFRVFNLLSPYIYGLILVMWAWKNLYKMSVTNSPISQGKSLITLT